VCTVLPGSWHASAYGIFRTRSRFMDILEPFLMNIHPNLPPVSLKPSGLAKWGILSVALDNLS
jgi:hypothetical protein